MNNLPLYVFLFFCVVRFATAIFELRESIDKIKQNCKFDKDYDKQIRRDIEILMNEIHIKNHGSRSGLNILIFDDETESTRLIAEKIRHIRPGCKIVTADNLTSAMYHTRMGGIDIIFADQRHHTEEYGTVLKQIVTEQKIKLKFILYSGGPKPLHYKGIFLDKLEIMKNPDILKEYL